MQNEHYKNQRNRSRIFCKTMGRKNKMKIKIKYFRDDMTKLYKLEKGDWVDLRAAQDMLLVKGEHAMIPLGVAMQLPEGYEALVVPRSSTFKKYGLIMTNSVGVIDESYCGDNDEWHLPVYATRDVTISKDIRLCQFRIIEHQPEFDFEEVDELFGADRGGFGSTGTV